MSKTIPAMLVLVSLVGCAGKGTRGSSGPHGSDDELSAQVVPLTGSLKVHRFRLDNGLRLLVVEDHSSPTFAYNTWFRVGSRDEEVGRTGLAHLFEHMMFKETKNLKEGQFDKTLESAGAEGENAFTSRDYTAYVQELPSDQLELIARLEAERMVNLVVNEKAFKTETEVVQNERRFRVENNPDGKMYQELFGTAFSAHPYHWPVIGYQEDLNAMKAKDALKFYRSFYSPGYATVIVSGDVDPSEVLSVVQKHYGTIPPQAVPSRKIPAEPPQTSPRRRQLKLDMQVEKLLMGYHVPAATHEDIPALNVVQSILTSGRSSRLVRALVDTGVASAVDAHQFEDKDPSLFMISVTLQKGRSATQAETIVLRELARLAREPASEAELARAKNKISFSFYEGLNANSERANFLGHYEAVAGDFAAGLRQFKKIEAVTADDAQTVARRYLDPKSRTVITGVKK